MKQFVLKIFFKQKLTAAYNIWILSFGQSTPPSQFSLNSTFHVYIAKVAEYPTQFVYRFVGAILVSSIDFHPD